MDKPRIAVLMTCYNRKASTLACLDALMNQESIDDVELQVYLVDDGCTDGTGDAVRDVCPSAEILPGNGNLYWCGGMRLAFEEAMKGDYDYYLWLNDDTMLLPNALRCMVDTSRSLRKREGREVITVAAVQDPKSGEVTYSGVVRSSYWRPFPLHIVRPSNDARACDTINGNCVLIPREVAESVGNLSPEFTHEMGDYDYGFRAKDLGFSCWVAPGVLGTCSQNPRVDSCKNARLPMKERLRNMNPPTGLPPAWEWMQFTRRHTGILWPVYWLRTVARACCPWLWVVMRSKQIR